MVARNLPNSLLASAIVGRNVAVHWHEKDKLDAFTDGQSIFLPSHAFEDPELISNQLIAQSLLLRLGSLDRRFLQKLIGVRKTRQRFAHAEIVRGTREFSYLLPRKFCQQEAVARFPFETVSASDSFDLATSIRPFPPAPDFIGSLRAVLLLKNSLSNASFSPLSKKQAEGKVDPSGDPDITEEDEDDAEESSILKLFQNPMNLGGSLSDIFKSLLGTGKSGRTDNDNQGGRDLAIGSVVTATRKGPLATLANQIMDSIIPPAGHDTASNLYPEWDYRHQLYRQEWAMVDEFDPWREEPMRDNEISELFRSPDPRLRAKLAGIGLSFETHRNQPDGDELALDQVIDYVIDQRLGTTPGERLYNARRKTKRDLATMVLLDISGSTGERDQNGRSILHKQMRIAYDLTSALHALGDQVALYGFHSWSRKMIRFLRIKSFEEHNITSRTHRRFSQLEPVGYTRTGAALRHAAAKLNRETGLPHRLLIVITDGFAYDHDYEDRYAEEDTKKALAEVRALGIGCLCLTIATAQERRKLAEVYGAASTLSVDDHESFIRAIRPAILNAITLVKAA